MVGAVHAVLLFLALAARPQVVLDDPAGCVSKTEMDRDLDALLPADVDTSGLTVRVQVAAVGDRRTIEARLYAAQSPDPLLDKSLDVAAGDCPTVPRLLATVVRRRLDGLPQSVWAGPPPRVDPDLEGPPPPPEKTVVEVVHKDEPAPPPPATPSPWRVRPRLAVGVGGGVWPWSGDVRLAGGVSVGKGYWPDAAVGLKAQVFAPVQVGGGIAQAASLQLSLGVAYEFAPWDWLQIVPRLDGNLGGVLASGARFSTNEVALLPWLSLAPEVAVYSGFGVFASVGVEVPLVGIVLEDRTGAQGRLPLVWGFVRVGFSWRFLVGD